MSECLTLFVFQSFNRLYGFKDISLMDCISFTNNFLILNLWESNSHLVLQIIYKKTLLLIKSYCNKSQLHSHGVHWKLHSNSTPWSRNEVEFQKLNGVGVELELEILNFSETSNKLENNNRLHFFCLQSKTCSSVLSLK